MKKFLLSTVALFGLTVGAVAADLPRSTPAQAPVPYAPAFTWTGFYAGVNAGYAWADSSADSFYVPPGGVPGFPGAFGTVSYGSDSSDGGFTGGGQIGYNWQFGSFVVGAEADLQYADLGSGSYTYFFPATFPASYVAPAPGGGIEWFGTVRLRAGVAFDRLLVYATGGFAYGGGDSNNNNFFVVGNGDDDVNTGWVLGGGVEYAVTPNVILGVEGLYVSLDREGRSGGGYYFAAPGVAVPVSTLDNDSNDNEFGVVRAKLNYKF